ncbi:MAG: hypothetical protein J2P24_02000 [Streptosporangiales bacterium]|nr:hypothetical protein [Streptosporangiales bacterium]MBO0891316.1 hypothetical protein [Acidothermales bacterium]
MALPRPVRVSLAGFCALLLGGLVGFAWWWFLSRRRARGGSAGTPQARRPSRLRYAQSAGVAVLLLLVVVGTGWRAEVAARGVPECRHPRVERSAYTRSLDASLVAEKVVTWPETGVGLLYGQATGSSLCRYAPADYYVDFHTGTIAGTYIMNVGDMVLAPPFDTRVHSGEEVADHEARHRPQWAVATVLGGPFAFPIVYGIDNFFFPASRNHFERMAGLAAGGYPSAGYGPVIGWPQVAVLVLAGVLVVLALYRRFRRR